MQMIFILRMRLMWLSFLQALLSEIPDLKIGLNKSTKFAAINNYQAFLRRRVRLVFISIIIIILNLQ